VKTVEKEETTITNVQVVLEESNFLEKGRKPAMGGGKNTKLAIGERTVAKCATNTCNKVLKLLYILQRQCIYMNIDIYVYRKMKCSLNDN